MKLHLKNALIKDREGRTKYRIFRDGGFKHYHVGLWLDPEGLDPDNPVVEVRYLLHPTFKTPERFSRNAGNDFSITFWTWGMFEVSATAILYDGQEVTVEPYTLQFDQADFEKTVDVSAT